MAQNGLIERRHALGPSRADISLNGRAQGV